MSEKFEREYDWDDEIVEEGSEYIVLDEGDYSFTVRSFDRARYNGGDKIPACKQAIVHIEVDNGKGDKVTINHNLYLHSKCERSLSNFFVAIGLKKKGEPFTMAWSKVPGTTGKCHVAPNEYNGKTYNNIKYFLEPEEKPTASFTPGSF